MCSTIDGLNKIKFHLTNFQSFNLTTTNDDDWCFTLSFMARMVAYVGVLALLVIVIFMIMRYIENLDNDGAEGGVGANETTPLRPGKTSMAFTYGTCGEDLETGNCSSGGGSSSSNISSSADLYDGKICIICYDEQRDCFFVPCGHCATCYVCAQRIFNGENKVCPVCRRFIGKVRKLFAA